MNVWWTNRLARRSKAVLADSDNDGGGSDEEAFNIANDIANKIRVNDDYEDEPIISDEEEVAREAIQ